MTKQTYDYDVIIIGGGAGGSVAAANLAAAGKKVALVEAQTIGNTSLYSESMPSKIMLEIAALYEQVQRASKFGIRSGGIGYNYPTMIAWKDSVITQSKNDESAAYFKSVGVTLLHGRAHFLTPHEISIGQQHLTSAHFIVATGSSNFIPDVQNIQNVPYLTAQSANKLTRPPKTLFIIGAGSTGCEFATLFSVYGTKVFLADIEPRILRDEDEEVSDAIQKSLTDQHHTKLLLNTRVVSVEKRSFGYQVAFTHASKTYSVKVDALLVTCGKTPNLDVGLENAGVEFNPQGIITNHFMQTNVPHIFATGDVVGPYHLTNMALHQSRTAAHNIIHPKKQLLSSSNDVARTIWTLPRVASVGLTENDCMKRIIDYKKSVAQMSISPASVIKDNRVGFVKLIIDRKKKYLLGASIVGPESDAMIHELALAVSKKLTVEDLANVIRAFPSPSDAIRSAATKLL